MSAGLVGKDTFEDLEVLVLAINQTTHPGAREALERMVGRVLRGLATPQGHTAEGLRQGMTMWQNCYVPLRNVEGNDE